MLCATFPLWSQQVKTIKGRVTIAGTTDPLPGASVYIDQNIIGAQAGEGIVSNYSLGTTTDMDGKFEMKVPLGINAVACSFIGFENQKIDITNKSEILIEMVEIMSALNEVVVTGYQNIERRKLTAAVAKIDTKDIIQNSTSSIDQMLTGQLSGVQITTVSGAPGAPAKIRIRGTSSLNGTQDPLWVLDGMPLEGTDLPDMTDKSIDQLYNSAIAGINPNDIEDITILKDAAATAIYGARAANGVIVITTKKGKAGRMIVNLNTNVSVTARPDFNRLDLLNASEKVDLELAMAANPALTYRKDKGEVARILNRYNDYNKYQNGGFSAISPEAQSQINALRNNGTNWGNELYQTAINHNHSLSISGGNETANYYFSAGYYDEKGTTVGTGMDRLNITLKTDFQLTRKLNVGVSLYTNEQNQESFLTGTQAFTNPSRYSRTANPYLSIRNVDGSYTYDKDIDGFDDKQINYNIVEERNATQNNFKNRNINAVFDLKYSIMENLKLTSQFGMQYNYVQAEKIADQESYYSRSERYKSRRYKNKQEYFFLPLGGIIKNQNTNDNQWNWKNMLEYNLKLEEIHEIDLMVGSELRKTYNESVSTAGYGYDKRTLKTKPVLFPDEDAAKQFPLYLKNNAENSYVSAFATASYTFDNRYTAFGSVRYDGSNLFGVDPKYRYLPIWSVGGAWNLKNEKWLYNTNWLSALKLRASYGLQGNIDRNTSPKVLGELGLSTILPGYTEDNIDVSNPPNPYLRWEKTSTWNAGVEMSVLRNRINMEVEVYHRLSEDLISLRALPLEHGFPTTSINWGEVTNKGIEFYLTTHNIKSKDFKWSTTFNIAKNINKVGKLNIPEKQVSPSREGHSVNALFAIKTAGLDEQGYPLFWKNGEKVGVEDYFKLYSYWGIASTELSNEELRGLFTHVGSLDPKLSGGFINNFQYKDFSLNISSNFNLGQWVKETPFYNMSEMDRGQNTTQRIFDTWSANNTNAKYPAIVGADSYNGARELASQWMKNGTHPVNAFNNLDIWYKEINYLRINSIRLGYNLPQQLVSRWGLSSVKVTAETRNPFVFGTNYDGYFDPETFGNIYAQPIAKTYSLGLNVTF